MCKDMKYGICLSKDLRDILRKISKSRAILKYGNSKSCSESKKSGCLKTPKSRSQNFSSTSYKKSLLHHRQKRRNSFKILMCKATNLKDLRCNRSKNIWSNHIYKSLLNSLSIQLFYQCLRKTHQYLCKLCQHQQLQLAL